MDAIILDKIAFHLEASSFAKLVRLDTASDYFNDLEKMIGEAKRIAKPKAIYKVSFIESKGDDFVVIDGFTFKSRVLRVNTDQLHRVFPFVVTAGVELDQWARSFKDTLKQYWAEGINGMALLAAFRALDEHLEKEYGLGKIAHMSPGSLADWPITEQRNLFALLGDTKALIGVELLDSCLMTPTKTASGIRFPTEKDFESCMLCPRENCPGRRAPYDKEKYDKEYRIDNSKI